MLPQHHNEARAMLSRDALSVVLRHVADLLPCVRVCKEWRLAVGEERRRRALGLVKEAFRMAKQAESAHADNGAYLLHGSTAVWLLAGKPDTWYPQEADLFRYGPKQADHQVRIGSVDYAVGAFAPPAVARASTAFGSVNFVISRFYKTAESIVETSDLSCCMVGYTHDGQCVVGQRATRSTVAAYVQRDMRAVTLWEAPGADGRGPRFKFANSARAHTRRTIKRAAMYTRRGYRWTAIHECRVWPGPETLMIVERSNCSSFVSAITHSGDACRCGGEPCTAVATYLSQRNVVLVGVVLG